MRYSAGTIRPVATAACWLLLGSRAKHPAAAKLASIYGPMASKSSPHGTVDFVRSKRGVSKKWTQGGRDNLTCASEVATKITARVRVHVV